MTKIEEKQKYREAGFKAWKTIKKEKREKAAKNSKKITQYINPSTIEKIKHPETSRFPEILELAWEGNRIVVPFHKTPPNIACGLFWELRWAYGCPLDCSYCYLRGTMRGRMTPQYVKTEHVLKALDEAFMKISTPVIFNTGELSDSLMNPKMMVPLVDKFEMQNKHKIYLLSKFGTRNIQFLLQKPRKQVICGWSINAPIVAKIWERSAPTPDERIEAAKLVSNAGYDTRIRIDPIFPIADWKQHYENLINRILSSLNPNRIILGTPRGLWKTIKYAKEAGIDMSWAQFFKEDSGWGKKLSFEQRKEIYQFFYDKLDSAGYALSRISMCKETVEMWNVLRMNYVPGVCNCYGKNGS
jgi:spore photoproduct lyase